MTCQENSKDSEELIRKQKIENVAYGEKNLKCYFIINGN